MKIGIFADTQKVELTPAIKLVARSANPAACLGRNLQIREYPLKLLPI